MSALGVQSPWPSGSNEECFCHAAESARPGASMSPAGPFGDLQAFEHGQAACLCPCVSLVPVGMAPKEMVSVLWAFCGPEIV